MESVYLSNMIENTKNSLKNVPNIITEASEAFLSLTNL